MGLDLYIMKEGKAKQNKKGQWYWKVTKICSMRNVWGFLEQLYLENCKIESKSGLQLWEAAHSIENDEERRIVLDNIKEANIKNSDEEFYNVEGWW